MPPLTQPRNAQENYARLLAFAQHMHATHPSHDGAVVVVDQTPLGLGLGLQAKRDILEGEIVVWYGGPYVRMLAEHGGRPHLSSEHATHAVQVSDPEESQNQRPRAIDGKIVSAAFQDPVVTVPERAAMLLISGAIMNSSRDMENNEIDISNVQWKPDSRLLRWVSPEGIEFAARAMVAKHFIPEGTDLRWPYPYKGHVTNPLGFQNMSPAPPPPPPAQPRKRVVPTPSGGRSSSSSSSDGGTKVAKTGADANNLVSLTNLQL